MLIGDYLLSLADGRRPVGHADEDGVTPDGRPDNAGSGALMGGATGATIGALADRGNPGAGALIGGVAGLIAGGLIGHSVDQENEARRQYYSAPPIYAAAPPPPLSVADIKSMSKAGVTDDNIIHQINTTHTVYHLDANAIIDLSNSGGQPKGYFQHDQH